MNRIKIEPKLTTNNKKKCWLADLRSLGGGRIFRPTRALAQAEIDKALDQYKVTGPIVFELTRAEHNDARQALEIIRQVNEESGANITLVECAREAQKRLVISPTTIHEAVTQFMHHKTVVEPISELGLLGYRGDSNSWKRRWGKKLVSAITEDDFREFMNSGDPAQMTRRNRYKHFSTFIAWCQERNMVRESPLARIAKPDVESREPVYLTITQCTRLLQAVVTHRHDVVGNIVLGLFGGLRPAETLRLDRSKINLKGGTIRLEEAKTKGRARRVVRMQEVLRAWLAYCEENQMPFLQEVTDKRLHEELPKRINRARNHFNKDLKAEDQLHRLPTDVLRHTFATYFYALTEDENKVRSVMGHGKRSEVLFQNYCGLVRDPDDVAKFWNLTPQKVLGLEENVIQMPAAGDRA